MLTKILTTLYVFAGLVGNFAYLPTIRDLWLLKPAANLQSYIIWSLTSTLVFTYAITVNRDGFFITLSCLTLCLCITVVVLELRRRRLKIQRAENESSMLPTDPGAMPSGKATA